MGILEPTTELLGRYQVKSLLGEGGMGATYLCFDKLNNREVAVKIPHHSQIEDPIKRERFLREYQLLAQLTHKNIVEVYELHEADEVPFFTMEYLQGNSLEKFIASLTPGRMSSKEYAAQALTLLRELADALRTVHSINIIHHDLKPENVLLVSAPTGDSNPLQVKLLDFGVALDKYSHTVEEAKVGSILYKSPEQYRGNRLDITSDIFAFGLVAYEVFTGRRPFDDGEADKEMVALLRVARKNNAGKVPDITTTHSKVRYLVNQMVQICLQKKAQHRYTSMDMVIGKIDSIQEVLESPSWFARIPLMLREREQRP